MSNSKILRAHERMAVKFTEPHKLYDQTRMHGNSYPKKELNFLN